MLTFAVDLLGFFLKALIVAVMVTAPLLLLALVLKKKDRLGEQKDGFKIVVKDLRQGMQRRRENKEKVLKKHHPDKRLEEQDPVAKKKSGDEKSAAQKNYAQARAEREAYVKELQDKEASGLFCPKNLFVLNFRGSTRGSEVKRLRKEVDALLDVVTDSDEVVVNLTSPGGMVNSYGLLASQLERIRARGVRLVCTVDEVAASGGYLMAVVASKIVAAPFAYIGSIGVIASLPNFHRLLKSHEVDYEQITAGRYKRTLTMFGNNTDEAREKFREELKAVHERFKGLILKYRPQVDIEKVATGEYWLALDALKLGLIDEIATSDAYLARLAAETYDCVLQIMCTRKQKQNLVTKLRDLLMLKHMRKGIVATLEDRMNDSAYLHVR